MPSTISTPDLVRGVLRGGQLLARTRGHRPALASRLSRCKSGTFLPRKYGVASQKRTAYCRSSRSAPGRFRSLVQGNAERHQICREGTSSARRSRVPTRSRPLSSATHSGAASSKQSYATSNSTSPPSTPFGRPIARSRPRFGRLSISSASALAGPRIGTPAYHRNSRLRRSEGMAALGATSPSSRMPANDWIPLKPATRNNNWVI
jgi:hypothetical protein